MTSEEQLDAIVSEAITELKKLPLPFKMEKIATYVAILELLMRRSKPKITDVSTIVKPKSIERDQYFDELRENRDLSFVLPDEIKGWFDVNTRCPGLYNHKVTDNRICKIGDDYYVNNCYNWIRYTNVYLAAFSAALSGKL